MARRLVLALARETLPGVVVVEEDNNVLPAPTPPRLPLSTTVAEGGNGEANELETGNTSRSENVDLGTDDRCEDLDPG